jgi:hypothetical protein
MRPNHRYHASSWLPSLSPPWIRRHSFIRDIYLLHDLDWHHPIAKPPPNVCSSPSERTPPCHVRWLPIRKHWAETQESPSSERHRTLSHWSASAKSQSKALSQVPIHTETMIGNERRPERQLSSRKPPHGTVPESESPLLVAAFAEPETGQSRLTMILSKLVNQRNEGDVERKHAISVDGSSSVTIINENSHGHLGVIKAASAPGTTQLIHRDSARSFARILPRTFWFTGLQSWLNSLIMDHWQITNLALKMLLQCFWGSTWIARIAVGIPLAMRFLSIQQTSFILLWLRTTSSSIGI